MSDVRNTDVRNMSKSNSTADVVRVEANLVKITWSQSTSNFTFFAIALNVFEILTFHFLILKNKPSSRGTTFAMMSFDGEYENL